MSKPKPHSKSSPASGVTTSNHVKIELDKKADVALLGGPTEDGKGVTVLRARHGRLEAGEVRPLEAGKPIVGDVVSLKPRKAMPMICDVQTHVSVPTEAKEQASASSSRSGPPQVASEAYRQNWEAIYQPGKKKPELLN